MGQPYDDDSDSFRVFGRGMVESDSTIYWRVGRIKLKLVAARQSKEPDELPFPLPNSRQSCRRYGRPKIALSAIKEKWVLLMKSILFRKQRICFSDSGFGPVVVLVHGFPLDRRMWTAQVPVLEKFCRVIAIDLPGYGDSPFPHETPSIKSFAAATAAVVESEQIETVTLVGLSMGGYVCWEILQQFPNLVSRLVLSNTRASGDTQATAKARRISAQNVREKGTASLITDMLGRLVAPQTMTRAPEAVAAIQIMMKDASPESVAATLIALADRADYRRLLPKIKLPVLVVAGEFDKITPAAEMSEMSASLSQSTYTVISDCGHLPPIEQPEKFNEQLKKFLVNS